MKTHYVLQKLIQGRRYVGNDWELDPDNTTCRNKLTSATTTFGADDTCPWCIELGVGFTLQKYVEIGDPYLIEGDRYVITVCSPSFVDDISEFIQTKLKEYVFTPTPDRPYGDDIEFHNVTKHWLFDVDWEDYYR